MFVRCRKRFKGRQGAPLLEESFLALPWREVRDSVDVKPLPKDGEAYVLARSEARVHEARVHKERSMRRRRLKKLWARLGELRE